MNLNFLGDALDQWKGSLFESLQANNVLRGFAVDPMASDQQLWTSADSALFARLLRIKSSQIIQHRVSLQDRLAYLQEIPHSGDLFVDPDTGVATGVVDEPCCYLYPAEIEQLLDSSPSRLLAIYQHVRGTKVAARVDKVLECVGRQIDNVQWCSYESSTVAMLFLARDAVRTKEVTEHFGSWLGGHAAGRIWGQPDTAAAPEKTQT
jgi:hypothetical protein